MKINIVRSRSFGSNTYIIVAGSEAYAVDPSISVNALREALECENATLKGVLLTHGHFDHLMALDTVREAFGVSAFIHEEDAVMLTDGSKNAFSSFFGKERTYRPAEKLLKDGDILSLGGESIRVMHTPGHTRGSVCFICGNEIITGDTLFAEGFGRCDLWGGDIEKLKKSLKALRLLPKDAKIYPGHGEDAILGNALDIVAYML